MHHEIAATIVQLTKNKTHWWVSLYADDTPFSATVWKTITETNCGLVSNRVVGCKPP